MEDKTYADNWFSIQDTVKDDFLSALKTDEVIELIKALHIRIPGFNKNFQKAPPKLLKNQLTKKMMQLPDIREFLKIFTLPYSKDFDDLESKELLKKIAANNEISHSQIIALVSMNSPNHYMELRKLMIQNREQDLPLLENVVEYSLIDTLEQLPNRFPHLIDELKKEVLPISREKFNLESYHSYFLKDYQIDLLPAMHVLLHQEELKDDAFTPEEELAFYRLALLELANHFQTETKELQKEVKQLQKQAEKTAKQLQDEKRTTKQLINELEEKEKAIQSLLDNKTKLDGKLHQATQEIERLQQEPDFLLLPETEPFILFTSRPEEFRNFIDTRKLKNVEMLGSAIQQFDSDTYLFVDGHQLSTAKKMEIAEKLKTYSGFSKLINGSITNVVKKIIYLIEGENTYETYEKTNR